MKKILLRVVQLILILNLARLAIGILNEILPEILLVGGLISLAILLWRIWRRKHWF